MPASSSKCETNPTLPFTPNASESFDHVVYHGSSESFAYPAGILASVSLGWTMPAAATSAVSQGSKSYFSHTLRTRLGR